MDEFHRQSLPPDTLEALLGRMAEQLRPVEGILAAVLYGSAAEGLPCRDLDVALLVDREVWPPTQDEHLEHRVTRLLASLAPLPVDVRVVNDAPATFRYHVTRGRPFLIGDEEAYATFLERTWDEYFDFAPFARKYFEEIVR
ncbi:MAG: nucleotidyltransferase domain-containing protein [Thermoflexales bacterium]|nr:nucleotidyltransferase domain-containing protein [Thermoflexales bacterium]